MGQKLYRVKWRESKVMVKEIDTIFTDPTRNYGVPLFYNLLLDSLITPETPVSPTYTVPFEFSGTIKQVSR